MAQAREEMTSDSSASGDSSSDECDYFDSDNSDYFSDADDRWCTEMDLDQTLVQRGGAVEPLFHFDLQRSQQPRRWRQVVERDRFTARLRQRRDPTDQDDLGGELTDAIHRAMRHVVANQNLQAQDRIHFTLQANAFASSQNHCHQSVQFTVEEANNNTPRFSTYLQQMANQLNSSQSFDGGDDFHLDVTSIRMPPSGRGKTKYTPAKAATRKIIKRSRILIHNKDALCCARAIVTMRAWVDEQNHLTPDVSYQALRKGHSAQKNPSRSVARVGRGAARRLRSRRDCQISSRADGVSDQSAKSRTPSHGGVCRPR